MVPLALAPAHAAQLGGAVAAAGLRPDLSEGNQREAGEILEDLGVGLQREVACETTAPCRTQMHSAKAGRSDAPAAMSTKPGSDV